MKNLFMVDQRILDAASKHIAFYTRKVRELFAVHPSRRDERWLARADRLKRYKTALDNYLVKNGLK